MGVGIPFIELKEQESSAYVFQYIDPIFRARNDQMDHDGFSACAFFSNGPTFKIRTFIKKKKKHVRKMCLYFLDSL